MFWYGYLVAPQMVGSYGSTHTFWGFSAVDYDCMIQKIRMIGGELS